MSIESNLKTLAENSTRIADALKGILNKMNHIGQAAASVAEAPAAPAQPAAAPTPPVAEQPAPTPPAPQAPAQPAAAPQAPAAPAAAMTPEELNNALIVEFQRLGSRDAIDAAIRELGATTITDLPAEQYQPLLAKVQAIPA